MFADKSAAWKTFLLTQSQIKLNLSLNKTTVFGFLCVYLIWDWINKFWCDIKSKKKS